MIERRKKCFEGLLNGEFPRETINRVEQNYLSMVCIYGKFNKKKSV